MLNSANQAWTMYPGLTHRRLRMPGGARHADEQKELYLPKLVSGQWTGTMCLTEPHCGTDLGMLRTKAEPQADGSYKITGTKIFISSGEHDLAENIVHLVLARLPDAPAGTKGISLFLVPKFLPSAERGRATARSASATASTAAASRRRWASTATPPARWTSTAPAAGSIGQPNKGLHGDVRDDERRAPRRRHAGAGADRSRVPERAAYAKDRIQVRSLSGPKAPDKPADPIIVHPDVRRMLLTAQAYAEGGRAFALLGRAAWPTRSSLDRPDEERKAVGATT